MHKQHNNFISLWFYSVGFYYLAIIVLTNPDVRILYFLCTGMGETEAYPHVQHHDILDKYLSTNNN